MYGANKRARLDSAARAFVMQMLGDPRDEELEILRRRVRELEQENEQLKTQLAKLAARPIKPEPNTTSTTYLHLQPHLHPQSHQQSLPSSQTNGVEDDDDCMIVDAPPSEPEPTPEPVPPPNRMTVAGDDEDLVVVGVRGDMLNLPHPRFLCKKEVFVTLPVYNSLSIVNRAFCSSCYCFVCDAPASECKEWPLHCNAHDKSEYWKQLRKVARNPLMKRLFTSPLFRSSVDALYDAEKQAKCIQDALEVLKPGTVSCHCGCHELSTTFGDGCFDCEENHVNDQTRISRLTFAVRSGMSSVTMFLDSGRVGKGLLCLDAITSTLSKALTRPPGATDEYWQAVEVSLKDQFNVLELRWLDILMVRKDQISEAIRVEVVAHLKQVQASSQREDVVLPHLDMIGRGWADPDLLLILEGRYSPESSSSSSSSFWLQPSVVEHLYPLLKTSQRWQHALNYVRASNHKTSEIPTLLVRLGNIDEVMKMIAQSENRWTCRQIQEVVTQLHQHGSKADIIFRICLKGLCRSTTTDVYLHDLVCWAIDYCGKAIDPVRSRHRIDTATLTPRVLKLREIAQKLVCDPERKILSESDAPDFGQLTDVTLFPLSERGKHTVLLRMEILAAFSAALFHNQSYTLVGPAQHLLQQADTLSILSMHEFLRRYCLGSDLNLLAEWMLRHTVNLINFKAVPELVEQWSSCLTGNILINLANALLRDGLKLEALNCAERVLREEATERSGNIPLHVINEMKIRFLGVAKELNYPAFSRALVEITFLSEPTWKGFEEVKALYDEDSWPAKCDSLLAVLVKSQRAPRAIIFAICARLGRYDAASAALSNRSAADYSRPPGEIINTVLETVVELGGEALPLLNGIRGWLITVTEEEALFRYPGGFSLAQIEKLWMYIATHYPDFAINIAVEVANRAVDSYDVKTVTQRDRDAFTQWLSLYRKIHEKSGHFGEWSSRLQAVMSSKLRRKSALIKVIRESSALFAPSNDPAANSRSSPPKNG